VQSSTPPQRPVDANLERQLLVMEANNLYITNIIYLMIPVKHQLTLAFLILLIVIAIITKIRSFLLACISIMLCLIYIFHGLIQSAKRKHMLSDKAPTSDNQCLLGNTKKINGIFANGCFDVWHVYHLLFWVLIGLLIPNHFILIGFVSASWEIIEHLLFKNEKALFGIENRCTRGFCGRIEDIVLNIIGYTIGSKIAICMVKSTKMRRIL
jgi:hypothetical protein